MSLHFLTRVSSEAGVISVLLFSAACADVLSLGSSSWELDLVMTGIRPSSNGQIRTVEAMS
jgi:hypothetical protein